MDLPDLPRTIKKKEADFGVKFRHWIEEHPQYTCSLELKQTGENSISFSVVKEPQVNWALAIDSDKGALIRVPGGKGEPDYVWLRNTPAYIVIKYPKFFCLIRIHAWESEKAESVRRSLTADRAREIADVIV
jgi:hypothetical protein